MTNTELKAAMLAKVPVIHMDMRHGTTVKKENKPWIKQKS